MRLGRRWLLVGLAVSLLAGLWTFLAYGLPMAFAIFGFFLALTLAIVYIIFERYLPHSRFRQFLQGELFHECTRKGRCCFLWVDLTPEEYKRILNHAQKKGAKEAVILKKGERYWLAHKKDGSCAFLERSPEGHFACRIYDMRPIACRLYPLVPVGRELRLDLNCPGLGRERGLDFTDYLESQGVLSYVRRNWAGAKSLWPKGKG